MANPNIAALTSVFGQTVGVALTSTAATSIIENAAASGEVIQINSLTVSNVDGTNPADITVSYYDQDALGGTAYPIVSVVVVPPGSTLVVISKETALKITEDSSIGATASAADDLTIVASYDTISAA